MVITLLFQNQVVSNMAALLLLFQDYVRVKFDVLKQSCVIIIQACLRKKKAYGKLNSWKLFFTYLDDSKTAEWVFAKLYQKCHFWIETRHEKGNCFRKI